MDLVLFRNQWFFLFFCMPDSFSKRNQWSKGQATLKEECCHAITDEMKIVLTLGLIETFKGIWEPGT